MFAYCWKEVSAIGRWQVKGSEVISFDGVTLPAHPPEEQLVRPIVIQVVDQCNLLDMAHEESRRSEGGPSHGQL